MLYIEVWKQTIDVQKHFNDIEMRIRGLALTVLTFALGGASLAIRESTAVILFGTELQFGALVLLAGTILWLTFYFVDQVWYHRLLIGAVKQGERLEQEIEPFLPAVGLTRQISESSPYELNIKLGSRFHGSYHLHSTAKIRLFYGFVSVLLLALAATVQFGI